MTVSYRDCWITFFFKLCIVENEAAPGDDNVLITHCNSQNVVGRALQETRVIRQIMTKDNQGSK